MNAPFIPPRPPLALRGPGVSGFFAALRTNALKIWGEDAYEQDSVVVRALGREWILLNEPAAIQHVMVTNAANYRRSNASTRMLRPVAGRGLLCSEGEEWRLQRRTTTPALAPRQVPLLVPHVARAIAELLPRLHAEAATGSVNLLAAMQELALEGVARAILSLEMGDFATAMRVQLGDYLARLVRPSALDLVLPPSVPTLRDVRRRRFRRRWVRLMDAIIAERAAAPPAEKPRDLYDLLSAARDPESGAGFNAAQLRDQMATLIVAGHETTALAMFWSLYLLANTPDVQARVAEEVAGADLGEASAAAALPRLSLTTAVLQEAMRLFPPAFMLVRQAMAPDRAGEVAIARGTAVMVAPWVLHRHRRLWTEPEAFRPERFLPGAPPPARFTYLPFGVGPRVCVGASFAIAEATLVLASLVQTFRIEMASDRPVLPVPAITTLPDHPPPFRLTPR